MNFAILDIVFGALLALFLVRGLLRGLIKEVAGLVGMLLGFFLASRFYALVVPYTAQVINNHTGQIAAAYLAIFLGVLVAVAIVAHLLQRFTELTFTSWLNHLLGGVAGLAKGGLVCSLAITLLHHFAGDSPLVSKSFLAGYIDQITNFAKTFLPAL